MLICIYAFLASLQLSSFQQPEVDPKDSGMEMKALHCIMIIMALKLPLFSEKFWLKCVVIRNLHL